MRAARRCEAGGITVSRLSDLAVQRLRPGSATHVSLLYPLHRTMQDTTGLRALAHLWQLDTALAILRTGGHGVLVTEDPVAWGTAVAHLQTHPLATEITALPTVVGRRQRLARGIVPYTPARRDLVDIPREPPQFSWGLTVGFRRGHPP